MLIQQKIGQLDSSRQFESAESELSDKMAIINGWKYKRHF